MTTSEPLPDGGSGWWPTPHGFGMDGHGNELSMAVRVAEGLSASERTARRMGLRPPLAEDDPQLTLWPEDSPASPSPSPARGRRRRIAGGSGQHSRRSFASYDPGTSSWKTFQGSLLTEWETYSATWPASGMTRNGTAYRLPSSVPPIYATESGLWRTPFAEEAAHPGRSAPRSRAHTVALSVQVNNPEYWPAPKGSAANYGRPRDNDRGDLQAAVLNWPTPRASDGPAASSHGRTWSTTDRNLHTVMRELGETATGGQLNPTWVEWLMGYPAGWTDSEDSATPSSPR
jgi:hypothetical protein